MKKYSLQEIFHFLNFVFLTKFTNFFCYKYSKEFLHELCKFWLVQKSYQLNSFHEKLFELLDN